jgi:glycosyltransferase involved in cell wall biosynthesis
MEYMFFGLPIVAYDLTEHRVSAQDAAVYAEPNVERALAEAVSGLLRAPAKRKEMSEYGASRVREKLVWQHSVPPLLAAYNAIFRRAERGTALAEGSKKLGVANDSGR